MSSFVPKKLQKWTEVWINVWSFGFCWLNIICECVRISLNPGQKTQFQEHLSVLLKFLFSKLSFWWGSECWKLTSLSPPAFIWWCRRTCRRRKVFPSLWRSELSLRLYNKTNVSWGLKDLNVMICMSLFSINRVCVWTQLRTNVCFSSSCHTLSSTLRYMTVQR